MIRFTYQAFNTCNKIDEASSKRWLKSVIISEGKKAGDIQYIFCDDNQLLLINEKFLNHDTFTDIITFPNTENRDIISGEIYISLERVNENCIKHKSTFKEEISRVMVHGILHLIGYVDKQISEKAQMRSKEDYYLHLQT